MIGRWANISLQRTAPCGLAAELGSLGGKSLLLALALSIVSMSSLEARAASLELGQPLPPDAVQRRQSIMISPADLKPVYRITRSGRQYDVCADAERRVVYISPTDRRFVTPEGVRLGMSFKDTATRSSATAQKFPGYLFALKLPSGWYAGFVQGESHTDGDLEADAKVISIFKSSVLW